MKKGEIIKRLADSAGVDQKTAKTILESFSELLVTSVQNGEKFTFPDVGIFSGVPRAARDGRNPMTGEKLHIPAAIVPKFMAAKAFKDALAASDEEKEGGDLSNSIESEKDKGCKKEGEADVAA